MCHPMIQHLSEIHQALGSILPTAGVGGKREGYIFHHLKVGSKHKAQHQENTNCALRSLEFKK